MSSHFHATGDFAQLRKIFISGNRACALVMFPMTVALLVMGKSVIEAWVGPRYVSSYSILLILLDSEHSVSNSVDFEPDLVPE